jgi:hypothetical protein
MKSKAGDDDPDTVPPMRRLAGHVFLASIAVALWALLFPQPYGLCMALLAAFPVVAIGMVAFSGGQLKFVNPAGEITTYAFMIIVLTSVILAYRSFDIHTVSWTGPGVAAIVLDLCFVGAVAFIDRPSLHGRLLFALAVLGLFWGIGCANFANALLDIAPKQIFRPTIGSYTITQGTSSGRTGGGGYSRHFVVGPWGPMTRPQDTVVSEFLYQRTKAGEPVCVSLGRGFFGAAWYSFEGCPASP